MNLDLSKSADPKTKTTEENHDFLEFEKDNSKNRDILSVISEEKSQ